MKKRLLYLFMLICSISLFVSCGDDDDVKYPVDSELAGAYKGTMDVYYVGVSTPIASDMVQKVYISKASDTAVKLELRNFTITVAGTELLIGDITVDNCALTKSGDTYKFSGNQKLSLVVGVCNTSVSGTIGKDAVDMVIDVDVEGGMKVKVNYKGAKLSETEKSEAKITSFTIDNEVVTVAPVIDEEKGTILFKVNDEATDDDLKSLTPIVEISERATVAPKSGVPQDFSAGKTVTYTVIAEDGTTKKYVVSIAGSQNFLKYSFDTWVVQHEGLKNEYWNPAPVDQLSTSNEGAGLLATLGFKGGFPVVEDKDGYSGSSAKLITLYTKGAGFGLAPAITSGSLFTGSFKTDASDQLNSTKFGIPYTKKPVIFKGIYKYTPGDNYVDGSDKKNVLEHLEIVDECSIMAVLYEAVDSEGKEVILTGHDIASSEYRVAVAVLEDGGAKAAWTTFELPFNNLDGKSYDMSKSYKLAIVCSSSKDGAAFKGAVNSTLIIDELEVIGE